MVPESSGSKVWEAMRACLDWSEHALPFTTKGISRDIPESHNDPRLVTLC